MPTILNELFRQSIDLGGLGHLDVLIPGHDLPPSVESLESKLESERILLERVTASGTHPPPGTGWIFDKSIHHWVKRNKKGGIVEKHPGIINKGREDITPEHLAPEHPDAEHVLSGLHDLVGAIAPKAAAKSGLMHRIGDAAITAAASVNSFLLRHHDQLDAIGSVLGAVLDMPADLKKFGYEPTASGVTLTGTSDALRAHAGIGTHLACTIASHVLAKALTWARGRMRGESLESTGGAWGYELAETMHDLFVKVNAALGLSGVPSIEEIAQGIQELAKG